MRTLIAVVTCHKFRDRADAQRETWVPLVPLDADVRFFLGGGRAKRSSEVCLDAPDGYLGLPVKVRQVFRWALGRGYGRVFKVDDDVYLNPGRLVAGPLAAYAGMISPIKDYASGFTYEVSASSMDLLAASHIDDWAEDRWVGRVLGRAGVRCRHVGAHRLIEVLDPRNLPFVNGSDGPRRDNDIGAVAELLPVRMREVHEEWEASCAPTADSSAARPLTWTLPYNRHHFDRVTDRGPA